MHIQHPNLDAYKVTRQERKQERDRKRALDLEREREHDRERDREREVNRQIFHERQREKTREQEMHRELQRLRHERLLNEAAADMDDDMGFFLPDEEMMERDDILPRLYQAVDGLKRYLRLRPVNGYLTNMMQDLVQLQNFCLFTLYTSNQPVGLLKSRSGTLFSLRFPLTLTCFLCSLFCFLPLFAFLWVYFILYPPSVLLMELKRKKDALRFLQTHPDRPLPWWMGYFSLLPTEIQTHILSFTDIKDLARVRSVCRLWNDLIQRECYWVILLEREFAPVRNRLHHSGHFHKTAQWLYRSKKKHLTVRDHIVGEWLGRYWNKTTLALWEGEWKDGRILGYGSKFIPASGDFYEGRWHDERLCGYGRADTRSYLYEGEWKDHLRHGKGTCTWKNSEIGYAHYVGEWQFDQMDGAGKMRYTNGDTYEGEWLDGMRDGLGTLVDVATGKEFRGIWERDRCEVAYDRDGQIIPDVGSILNSAEKTEVV